MNTENEWLATLQNHRDYAYQQGFVSGFVWTAVGVLVAAVAVRIFWDKGC